MDRTHTRTHEHGWDPDFDCVDLADDCCVAVLLAVGGGQAGLIWSHDVPGWAQRCSGAIRTSADVATSSHTVGSVVWAQTGTIEGGDLTLTPSVHCPGTAGGHVDFHGFVKAGRWVPA